MKIYVCVKHVPDSAATITVKDETDIEEAITFLINPYDEHAITEAHRLKSLFSDAEIIAVSVAKAAGKNTLRSALAMGADRGILVTTDERLDSIMTARALKAAILSDGQPELILTGKESIDAEGMQTMFRLAHLLGLPAATNVVSIEPQNDRVLISCEKEAGALEKLQLGMRCILAAGKGLNTPRYPTFPEIVKARKKEIKQITLAELNLAKADSRVELVRLEPIVENREPQELTGSPVEIAAKIVQVLSEEARVI